MPTLFKTAETTNMTRLEKNQIELTKWVREALEKGDFADDMLIKRSVSRAADRRFMFARPVGATASPNPVRLWNVSRRGIGFVTRKTDDGRDFLV